jgi:hypothetical protein
MKKGREPKIARALLVKGRAYKVTLSVRFTPG